MPTRPPADAGAPVPARGVVLAVGLAVITAIVVGLSFNLSRTDDPDGPGRGTGGGSAESAVAAGSEKVEVLAEIRVPGLGGEAGDRCAPVRRYAVEVGEGVAVLLLDEDDNVLGKGALAAPFVNPFVFSADGQSPCSLHAEIPGVPADLPGYWVQVGDLSPRWVEHSESGTIGVRRFVLVFD